MLPMDIQDEILTIAILLEQFGPQLSRPHVDTLNGSRHANMKELRFDAAGGCLARRLRFRPETQGCSPGGW